MRAWAIGPFFLAALSLAAPAGAQVYPPNTLLSGEIQQTVVSSQCYIGRGGTDFLRNAATDRAYMSISEMIADGYDISGHMILVFTSTTAGTVHFNLATDAPAGVQVAPFTGYAQSFSVPTKSLRVQFTIGFPACGLPVTAVYSTP